MRGTCKEVRILLWVVILQIDSYLPVLFRVVNDRYFLYCSVASGNTELKNSLYGPRTGGDLYLIPPDICFEGVAQRYYHFVLLLGVLEEECDWKLVQSG